MAVQIGFHDLERHQPAQGDVLGTENKSHAAAAQKAQDAVIAQPADLVRLKRRQQKGIGSRPFLGILGVCRG